MNIHFFHPDPVINANYLDDTRVIKMITENLQMMAAALHRHEITNLPLSKSGKPYRITHKNHPSTIWAGDSQSNLLWLVTYTEALYNRYKRSGGQAFKHVPSNLQRVREEALQVPDGGLTSFVNCAANKDLGIDFKHIDNVFKAYEMYMNERWDMDTIKLSWSGIEL